jgi:peptidyl-prolyl cis-trans isomerase B (cyclophilin B)
MYKFSLLALATVFLFSCSSPEADFEASYANGEENPTQLKFTNKSSNSDSYTWYFGDGSTSTVESPIHEFQAFGSVMVVLEAKKGPNVTRDTNYVNIPEPPRKQALIETPMGNMVVELFNTTPLHRDNFLKLVSSGFYDGLLFHRVMDNFMVQGGDPDSRDAVPGQQLGLGDPGYTITPEIRELHYKGALAAARKPTEMPSSGSQFYIVEGKKYSSIELANVGSQYGNTYNEAHKKKYAEVGGTPFLDNQYTVFGQVIKGIEVLDVLSTVEVDQANRPLEDIKMKISVINE